MRIPLCTLGAMAMLTGCISMQEQPERGSTLLRTVAVSPPNIETVSQQEILTPIPVRVFSPDPLGTEHALVYYRTFGSRAWSLIELGRAGENWAGAVPCSEVGTITGPLQLFVHLHDRQGRLLAALGSPRVPYVVPVVYRLPSGPVGLAGGAAPWRCADPADCPPDFPGCPPRRFLRPPCRSARDCAEGETCSWDGYCDGVTPELPRVTMPWER